MQALKDMALGAVAGVALIGTLATPGCGAALTPQLVECKLDALRVLPKDPKMVTPYDLEDLVNRVNACEAQAAGDGGSP